ncbi:fms interacting, partial [Colletotrichum incanum]
LTNRAFRSPTNTSFPRLKSRINIAVKRSSRTTIACIESASTSPLSRQPVTAAMAVNDLVSDKKLGAVLQTSGYAQDQALKLLQLLSDIARAEEASVTAEQLQATLSKEQKLLLTNISHLRGLHRSANFDARDTKAQTAEARHEVDRLHLQLQNLYYEQRHLEGEIEACESYDHTYQKLPLIPVDEFVALHPEHANDDENAMMIARIGHERAEREALEQQRLELVGRKQKLIADNKKRKDDLANLDKDLEKFIDVCPPFRCSVCDIGADPVGTGCETHPRTLREGCLSYAGAQCSDLLLLETQLACLACRL